MKSMKANAGLLCLVAAVLLFSPPQTVRSQSPTAALSAANEVVASVMVASEPTIKKNCNPCINNSCGCPCITSDCKNCKTDKGCKGCCNIQFTGTPNELQNCSTKCDAPNK